MQLKKYIAYASIPVILLSSLVAGGCDKPEPTTTETTTTTPTQYELFLSTNPDVSEGFTQDEYQFALEHLERTPEVMNEPELYEAFNAKIKIEEDLLKDLGLYPASEMDWNEIILANWSDVYNRLYKGGEAQGAIAESGLAKRLPNEKDREIYYMGLWVPQGLHYYNPSTDWGMWLNTYEGKPHELIQDELERLPYGTLTGRDAVVENLNNMPVLASNTMQAYNDPDLFLHDWSLHRLDYTIPEESFPNSKLFNDKYVQLYKQYGDKEIDLARFIHAISRILYREDQIGVDEVLCKSLGLVMFEQRAPYHHGVPGHGTHGEPAIPVPEYILSEIRANPDKYGIPVIGPGQSIGFVPNLESVESDGIPYLEFRMPNGVTLMKLDDKYDLSNKN